MCLLSDFERTDDVGGVGESTDGGSGGGDDGAGGDSAAVLAEGRPDMMPAKDMDISSLSQTHGFSQFI